MEKELLFQYLTKRHNKTEEEITSALYEGDSIREDAFETVQTWETAKAQRIKDDLTKQFNDGHKKGKAEVAHEHESYLITELGLEGIEPGDREKVVGAIKEQLASSKAKGKEITPDDIKKHPFFLDYEKNVIPKEKYETVTQEFEGYKTKVARDQKFSHVKNHAKKLLETFNPDFTAYADAPQIKNKLVDLYVNEFDELEDVELDDNGNVIAMVKDGKRLEDEHMNVIKFDEYAKKKASNYFKFLVQSGKGNTGNGKTTTTTGGNGSFFTGKTRSEAYEEYIKIRSTGKENQETLAKMNAEIVAMQS